jgi:hypothetical protein
MTTRLVVERNDLCTFRWAELPTTPLDDGEVRLRIDTFALTSNNITYAALGDAMNYWQFFPTGDPSTGHVPVRGFASVVESRSPGVDVGERFYGYWPIGDDIVLQAEGVHPGGFTDGAEHRRALHPIYNQYVRCSADPGYLADREAQQALLRPQTGSHGPQVKKVRIRWRATSPPWPPPETTTLLTIIGVGVGGET